MSSYLAYGGCAAIRVAVKTEQSYRNDTIIAILYAVIKNKDYAQVALASSDS